MDLRFEVDAKEIENENYETENVFFQDHYADNELNSFTLHELGSNQLPSTSAETVQQTEKRRLKKVSMVDKQRLVKAYEDGEDYLNLGRLMEIKISTVRNIVHRYRKSGLLTTGRVGGSKTKISDAAGESLLKLLDKDPYLTLKMMTRHLELEFNISCTDKTVSNFLHGKLISFKLSRGTVDHKNSEIAKLKRKQYVERFLTEKWCTKECIYIDECSFNIWMRNRRGWARQGERLYQVIPTKCGVNISMVLAISKAGPVHFKLISGSFRKDTYEEFIRELDKMLDPGSRRFLIHDNATVHGAITLTEPLHELFQLPPYSTFLNPIESVFSTLKESVRRQMNNSRLSPTTAGKIAEMKKIVVEELEKNKYKNLKTFYKHIHNFFLKSLYLEDIFGG